jgi:hypothetical protein
VGWCEAVGDGNFAQKSKKAFISARPTSLPCPPQYLDAVKNITRFLATMLRSASALLVYWRVVVVVL